MLCLVFTVFVGVVPSRLFNIVADESLRTIRCGTMQRFNTGGDSGFEMVCLKMHLLCHAYIVLFGIHGDYRGLRGGGCGVVGVVSG